MSSPPDDFSIVHFSTEALPAGERVPMWRDFYGPLIARVDIEPLSDGPPTFEANVRVMPGLTIANVTSSPVRLERKSKHFVSEDDRVCLAVSLSGGGWLSHLGRELARPAGGAYLCSHCDPLDAALGQGTSRFTTLSIPRRTLAAVVPQFENHFMRPIAPDTEALRLLIGYIEVLDQQHLSRPDLRRVAVTHVHDLVALALGAGPAVVEMASARGLRAARLHAIKSDIRAALGQQDLTLTALAARHGVSPRYVQALLESDGTTFSQFLLGERLARAHRLLSDPLQMGRSISTIAYTAGFSDLSYFNRAFRRRYGATPSEIRAVPRDREH
jgi:AraC-like DNA-binding protein